uniref:Uncharacterized protein n=1 Tax=Sphaerodactylus townsendi TaxID=933632 RepID=A0ACB8F2P8_9SAUR
MQPELESLISLPGGLFRRSGAVWLYDWMQDAAARDGEPSGKAPVNVAASQRVAHSFETKLQTTGSLCTLLTLCQSSGLPGSSSHRIRSAAVFQEIGLGPGSLQAMVAGMSVPDLKPASFSVFDLVSNFCNDIVSSAQSFISSTWTFYLQSDDGKVVVFQSQPEIEYPVPEVQAPKSEVSEKAWTVSNPNTVKPHTGLREKLEKPPIEEPKSKNKGHPPMETPPSAEHDFLGCMSNQFEVSSIPMASHNLVVSLWRGASGCYRRSGLPRWILAACLFLSIMVMLWLSCASLVTAPDQHVKTQAT